MRSVPEVFGEHLTSEIGAPQDYNTNKTSGTFPSSYDLRIPGTSRAAPEIVMNESKGPATPARGGEENKADVQMRSATTSKETKPARDYMPIKALTQFTNDWVIKARVLKKANLREWSNPKSSGVLLNFDLVDREGTQIQATAFQEAARTLDGLIEQDSVYTFAGGLVKLANKKFTTIKNDYCLTFGNDAHVMKCDDDDDIEGVSFNFTDLSEIESMVQSRVLDVIGVILNVGPMSEINLKDGKVRQKRSLTIGDESNSCIGVTLWGPVTESHRYGTGQVIAFKNCRVSDYNGKSLNASSAPSDIVLGSAIKDKRG